MPIPWHWEPQAGKKEQGEATRSSNIVSDIVTVPIGVIKNVIVNANGKWKQAEAARSSATVSAIVTVELGVVLHANVNVMGKQKQAEAGNNRQKKCHG